MFTVISPSPKCTNDMETKWWVLHTENLDFSEVQIDQATKPEWNLFTGNEV